MITIWLQLPIMYGDGRLRRNASNWIHSVLYGFWIQKIRLHQKTQKKNYDKKVMEVGIKKKIKNPTMDFYNILPIVNGHLLNCSKS